ncbi:hypothetical protein NESM_000705000 [Novymonas esmeraldas]|uniref:RING-type domain-containing protein n=1 Tax=Novymonas esmeraldas TaxID=1808958 RepID=A0AAW0EUU7_9TRYP
MSDGVWRNFRFFDSEPLPTATAAALAELSIVCTCVTPTAIVVGDYEGQVCFLDRHPGTPGGRWSFHAYAGAVTHIRYCALRNALVTIGDDDALNTAILRVWDLDQLVVLYRGLLSHPTAHTTTTTTATTGAAAASPTSPLSPAVLEAPLRWRPPCQEHRLVPAGRSVSGAAEDLPLVPILLDSARQLQYHFKPTSAAAGTAAAAPPPPTSSSTPPPSQVGTNRSTGGNSSSSSGGGGGGGVVSCGSIRSAVVCFDVASDLSCAAVGLVTRDCVVLKGDLAKERSARATTIRSGLAKGPLTFVGLPSTQLVALPEGKGGSSDSAGGVSSAFALLTSGTRATSAPPATAAGHASGVQVLYTVYEDAVTCWALRANGNWSEYPCPIPSGGGAPHGGAALTSHGELLLLGRPSAVQSSGGSRIVRIGPARTSSGVVAPCDPTAKASVQFIDVEHVPGRPFFYTHRHYLALLVQHDGRPEQFQLQCLDLAYRIRGLSRPQETYTNCAAVLGDGADLLVLVLDPATRTRQLVLRGVRLREADTQTKLELLFSKECYGIAQQLAQTMEDVDPTLHLRIRKRYGDYLYDKGKMEDAMTQYVDTIGHLESSYVIRRFMGSANMEQLIRYLEELHKQRHSAHTNGAHTTLLLTCYSKLKDEARLSAFIHRDDVAFDAKNAIQVCRDGGYAAAALYLADRYAAVHDCARVRLYDMQEPLATLAYIRTLGVDEAEQICAQLGKDLLLAAPRATTELLMELCVHWKGPGRRLADSQGPPPQPAATAIDVSLEAPLSLIGGLGGATSRHPHRADASAMLHLLVDAPVCLMNFLRAVIESGTLDAEDEGEAATTTTAAAAGPAPHAALFNTLLELYMTRELRSTLRLVPRAATVGGGGAPRAGVAAEAGEPLEFPAEAYERRLEQARTFLEAYKGRYDPHLALSLAHQHRFQDGILYLLRTLGLSEDVLSYYGAKLNDPGATAAERHEATTKLFQACQESPASDSSTAAMWMTLLAQLVRTATTEWREVVTVLDYIEAHDVLPPVVVLEILSNNPQTALELRTVRDYCQRCLLKQTRRVQEAVTQTAQRLDEVERIKKDVVALQTSAVVFQSTACAHCHQALDTPTVYFMCKHAFHHRCLYTPTECNLCAAAHRRRLDAIRDAEQRDVQRQNPTTFTAQFFQDVKCGRRTHAGAASTADAAAATRHDGFGVVADYIARGVLGAPPLHADAGVFAPEAPVPLHGSRGESRGAEDAFAADDLDVW